MRDHAASAVLEIDVPGVGSRREPSSWSSAPDAAVTSRRTR